MSKHVVFLVGESEYHSEMTMPIIANELTMRYGMTTSVLHCKSKEDLPGLSALNDADCVVMYLRFRELRKKQTKRIREYLDSNRPVVGLRTSTHAFGYPDKSPLIEWNNMGDEVFGTPWRFHYGHESSTIVHRVPAQTDHPILRNLCATFVTRSWLYYVLPLPEACQPLLLGNSVGPSPRGERVENPVAWTREDGRRVFYTSLGHPDDFEIPSMRRLVVNGILWALGEPIP
ncbi:MAG: ThuA domain-containing protein [Candidatus Poribacteria bacterium]|nr:ThuA domain-containing protein [Candidatus Poribacteria bacterium]